MTGSKAQEQQLPAAWQAAKGMIHAAESDAKRSRDDLATLLEKSSNVYFPGLGDPFDADFTTHRWLRGAREEVYSDWLAWIIERQASGEDILSLFGIETELKPAGPISVQRELAVGDGRLDLCIRFGTRGTLVVEVKTRSVPDAEQLARYLSWVKGQPGNLGVVLLVPNRLDEELPEGVALCSWWDVAERFRDWSSRWLAAGRGIEAALALSFCGAVEQNILGLGTTGLEIVKTLDYIEGWMKETKMPVKRESTLIWEGCRSYHQANYALGIFREKINMLIRQALRKHARDLAAATRLDENLFIDGAKEQPWAEPERPEAWIGLLIPKKTMSWQLQFYLYLNDSNDTADSAPALYAQLWVEGPGVLRNELSRLGHDIEFEPDNETAWIAEKLSEDSFDLERSLDQLLTRWIDLWQEAGGMRRLLPEPATGD